MGQESEKEYICKYFAVHQKHNTINYIQLFFNKKAKKNQFHFYTLIISIREIKKGRNKDWD